MKNLRIAAVAGVLLCAAGIMTATAQSSSTIITFSVNMATNLAEGTFNPPPPAGTGSDAVYAEGTFNNWANTGLQLVEEGSSTIWTNSYNDIIDANGDVVSYLYDVNGSAELTGDYDNRADYLPATSGASLVIPTQFYGDVGPAVSPTITFRVDMSEEIELGNFVPSNGDTVVVAGSFNGWSATPGTEYTLTNDPSIIVTNDGIVESNVYTCTALAAYSARYGALPATNSCEEWKYVEDPSEAWETPGPATADDNGNRFFLASTNEVLPIVSFNDESFYPSANVTLNVDMSGPIKYDPNYVPNSVTVWGTFNSWASGVQMTNNPAALNPNIFSTTVTTSEGATMTFQVRYTNSLVAASDPSSPWVYDYVDDAVYDNNARRTVTLPVTSTTLTTNLPTFYFLDLALDDYIPQPTPVLFSVNMDDAIATNGYTFNPSSDSVYINGMFANGGGYPQAWYPWAGGINPVPAPAGYQMIEVGSTTIYTNTIVIPAGTPVALSYQYGMDPGSLNGGPLEDEATSGANHFRAVRSTALNPYTMPLDAFTNQPYVEPLFAPGNIYENMGTLSGGDLTIAASFDGGTRVSWLGRPGAHLQNAAAVNGPWTDIWVTDGTNWTNGVYTPNGLMSVTNWSATGGHTFFRLVKP